jgi:hypothetical protein
MAWWEIGNGNVLGDHPADLVGRALEAIGAARAHPKPALAELLDALAAAIRFSPAGLMGPGDGPPFRRLVAESGDGARVHGDGATLTADDPTVAVLTSAIERIATAYRQDWERNPRLAELLEAFLFVLGYRPDRYLSGTEQLDLRALNAE